ncbi:YggT family protein [bacterium]|nr:YggT family protein [candidate division CSSED10-310 bacterium]
MSITFLTAIQLIVNVMILAFIMKLTLNPRDFFFNPALRPVDYLTTPVLKPFRKIFRTTQTGWDYTPLIGIVILIVINALALFVLDYSDLNSNLKIVMAFVKSFKNIVGFLVPVFSVFVMLILLIPAHASNVLANFFLKIIQPVMKLFQPFTANRKMRVMIVFILFFIIIAIIWHVLLVWEHDLIDPKAQAKNLRLSLEQDSHLEFRDYIESPKVFLFAVIDIANKIVNIYWFLIILLIVSAILSWVDVDPSNPFMQLIREISDPMLEPLRKVVPTISGLDISPIIAIVIIKLIGMVIIGILDKILNVGVGLPI